MTEKKEDTSYAVKGVEGLFEEALAAVEKVDDVPTATAPAADEADGTDGDDLNIVWDDDPTEEEVVADDAEPSGAPSTPAPQSQVSQGALLALEKELQVAKEALEEQTTDAKTNYDKFVRVTAEFDNFRKRTQREKEDLRRFGHKGVMSDMLDVLDNFDRALETLKDADESIRAGIDMVHRQFLEILSRHGAKSFVSLDEPFDYNLHQAISTTETNDQPPEHIHSVFKEGYMLHDQLLRPAMVIVAKAPAAPKPDVEEAPAKAAADEPVEAAPSNDAPADDTSDDASQETSAADVEATEAPEPKA